MESHFATAPQTVEKPDFVLSKNRVFLNNYQIYDKNKQFGKGI